MTTNKLMGDEIADVISALANKEIELCTTQDQLLATKKRWDKYYAGLNKFMAGKGVMPYFDEKGNVCYDQ